MLTLRELIENLNTIENKDQIVIGHLFTAEDFADWGDEVEIDQATFGRVYDRWERDPITREFYGWIGDLVSEELENN